MRNIIKHIILVLSITFMASCSVMDITVNEDMSNEGNYIYKNGKPVAEVENINYQYYKGKKVLEINLIQYTKGFDDNTDLIVEYIASKHPKAKVEIKPTD